MISIDQMKSEEPGGKVEDTMMKEEPGLTVHELKQLVDQEEEKAYVNRRIGKKISEKKPNMLADHLDSSAANKDPTTKTAAYEKSEKK